MRVEPDAGGGKIPAELAEEVAALRAQVGHLKAENARLARLLDLRPADRVPPGPVQTGIFDARPGSVHAASPSDAKVAFFGALFAVRDPLGEPQDRPFGVATGGARRLAQGCAA
ncbi:MAG: hypothetical protein ACRDQB_11300 [Thermocrispum sp.]